MDACTALVLVKVLHTVVWAFLAGCVLAIPVTAIIGRLRLAALLSAIVLLEVAVLALNSMRCPLTDIAARYTEIRSENFDIYLPAWLARNNKRLFGALWIAGELVLGWCWRRRIWRSADAPWEQSAGGGVSPQERRSEMPTLPITSGSVGSQTRSAVDLPTDGRPM
jgi:hypothetical protein